MPTFPTATAPRAASDLILPGALKEVSHSGIYQVRATLAAGWSFEFEYGILTTFTPDDMAIMSFINQAWNRGISFDITHPTMPGSGVAPNGLGTAGVRVKGPSQTGASVIIDGYENSISNVIRAGDLLKIAADDGVYQCWEDAGSDGTGAATVSITPNLRMSPANDAAVTLTAVTFKVILLGRSRFAGSRAPYGFSGAKALFSEFLNT